MLIAAQFHEFNHCKINQLDICFRSLETSFQKRNVSSSSSEDEDEDEEKKKIMQVDEEEEQELNEDAPLLRPNFERVHPGRKLLKALFPFTEDKFKFASLFGKIFMIIRVSWNVVLAVVWQHKNNKHHLLLFVFIVPIDSDPHSDNTSH